MKLAIVCGPPAAGKTVYGRALARQRGAVFLDSDVAAEPVVRAGMAAAGLSPDDRDSPRYKEIFREPVYEALYALAAENLAHLEVVIAGPFTSECRDVGWPRALEGRFGVLVEVHFLYCDPEIRRERMRLRGEPRDLAKLARWESYLRTTMEERPRFPHVFIDAGAPE